MDYSLVFYLAPSPLTAWKSKSWTNEKNTQRYHHFTHMYQKLWSHCVELLTEFFLVLGHFWPIYPSNNPENQNFENEKKKTPGNITILNMCTLNENQMIIVPQTWSVTVFNLTYRDLWLTTRIFIFTTKFVVIMSPFTTR